VFYTQRCTRTGHFSKSWENLAVLSLLSLLYSITHSFSLDRQEKINTKQVSESKKDSILTHPNQTEQLLTTRWHLRLSYFKKRSHSVKPHLLIILECQESAALAQASNGLTFT